MNNMLQIIYIMNNNDCKVRKKSTGKPYIRDYKERYDIK